MHIFLISIILKAEKINVSFNERTKNHGRNDSKGTLCADVCSQGSGPRADHRQSVGGNDPPLAGGRLTGKYQHGIPSDSRAGHDPRYLKPEMIDEALRRKTAALSAIAERRGQTLAQLALQWVLRDGVVTSALIGASRPQQVVENIAALSFPALTEEELAEIEAALNA